MFSLAVVPLPRVRLSAHGYETDLATRTGVSAIMTVGVGDIVGTDQPLWIEVLT
jgi:hypothetical protein